jgi:ATP-dependent Lon protease
VPRQVREAGLTDEQIKFADEALQGIISRYTREAGVRQLERNIGSVARKIALKVAQGKGEAFTIKPEELEEYLGHEMFFHEMARQKLPPELRPGWP